MYHCPAMPVWTVASDAIARQVCEEHLIPALNAMLTDGRPTFVVAPTNPRVAASCGWPVSESDWAGGWQSGGMK
jgi:hypothetical protein